MTTIGAHLERVKRLIIASATERDRLGTPAALRHLAHRLGLETTLMVFDLWLAERVATTPPRAIDDLLARRQSLQDEIARQVPLSLQDLALNGHDLQRLGIPPGPLMGRILHTLLHRVLDDPACNTRDRLLSVVQSEFASAVSPGTVQPPATPT